MKSKFSPRCIYGIGLACVAIGFAMPMIKLLYSTLNGFDIFSLLDAVKPGIEIAGYVLFGCACVGAICAFISGLKIVDLISFLGIIGSFVYVIIRLGIKASGGKSSGGKLPSFITDLAMEIIQPGLIIFAVGLIVAIVGFVLSLGKKR